MKKYLMGILFSILTLMPLAVQAGEPVDTIKTNVDKVLNVLRDPALQGESAVAEKKQALRRISNEMFDWPILSKRVLSKNWNTLNANQQKEFIELFKDILEQAYINKILAYKDEKIEYTGNRMLSDKQAEVETQILSSDSPVNLTYRLILMNGKWGVYDIIVEGVSLTQNYRKQFREFLATKTAVQLLDYLREKVDQQKA
jgi:phospholipid transport system substrate-binding protein